MKAVGLYRCLPIDNPESLLDEAAGLIEAGVLKTTLTQNLGKIDAANLRRAHAMLEQGHVIGKLVLEGW